MFLRLTLLITIFSNLWGELSISVASNFREPMKAVANDLWEKHGIKTQLSFSSSGKLLSQIEHGKPVDIFLSADTTRPEHISKNWKEFGLLEPPNIKKYALGELYLISHAPLKDWETALKALSKAKKIAIANPRHAPYGIVANNFLKNSPNIKSTLVMGENVAQAFHFFYSGAVDFALVSSAQALSSDRFHYIKLPSELAPPVEQSLVVIQNSNEAQTFLNYLKSKDYLQTLTQFGYKHPDAKQ